MSQAESAHHKQSKTKAAASVFAALVVITSAVCATHAQVVKGTGTPNTIPLWGNNSMQGNSMLSQSSGSVKVNGGITATGNLSAPSFSGAFFGNGSGLSNVNAALLGGLGPGGFAQLGASNIFSNSQTIEGNLQLTGSFNNTLTLQGDLTGAPGEQGANVIGGFGGNSTVPGNSVTSGFVGATIAGGGGFVGAAAPNTVTDDWGTVGGGAGNNSARFGTVGGGAFNAANGFAFSTVGGGRSNIAGGLTATVGGGESNLASGNTATVPGGMHNVAAGQFSFAAGFGSHANSDGSFVWTDGSTATSAGASDTGPNQFVARATGGFTFYTAPDFSTGATLATGSGSWSTLSDRNVKANFMLVDGEAILKRLSDLPIETWNYKAQGDSVRHMGPMAQDFRDAFGLGEDERHISTVDAQGVALAAIQALYHKLSQKQEEVNELQNRLTALENRLAAIESAR